MSDPATPTPQQRAETRATAARIMESVRRDEKMPLDMHTMPSGIVLRAAVEDLVFRLAQEIELQADHITKLEANAIRMREYRFAMENIPTDGKGNPLPGDTRDPRKP